MVFFIANHPSGMMNGCSAFSVKSSTAFFNRTELESHLKSLNPKASNFVLTGFNELTKSEYETYIA